MFSECKYTKYLVRIQKNHDFFGIDSKKVMTFSELGYREGMMVTELTTSPGVVSASSGK